MEHKNRLQSATHNEVVFTTQEVKDILRREAQGKYKIEGVYISTVAIELPGEDDEFGVKLTFLSWSPAHDKKDPPQT